MSIQMIKVMHVCVKTGSKEALTVLIVTHVTQVERVKSGVCGSAYSVYSTSCSSKGEGYLFEKPSILWV